MRSLEEQLAGCLELAEPLPALEVVLRDALGCMAAVDVTAPVDLPGMDVATCEGYAVPAEVCPDGALRVLDDLLAGAPDAGRVIPGTAVRVASGCMLPLGSDAVVPARETDGGLAEVVLRRAPVPGENMRRQGSDVAAGDVVVPAGRRIGSRQLGLLAAVGIGRVPVAPRPRVVVLPVGSDLVEAGRPPVTGSVFDASGHALVGAATEHGAAARRVVAAPDDRAGLRETVEDQLVRADLLVIAGGQGAGRADTVPDVLAALGEVRFDDVAFSPGGRFGFGVVEGVLVAALPGDPVAAQIVFDLVLAPVIRRLAAAEPARPAVQLCATSGAGWPSPAGRRQYVPVTLRKGEDGGSTCEPVGHPARPTLKDLAGADALAVVPEDVDAVAPGDELDCVGR